MGSECKIAIAEGRTKKTYRTMGRLRTYYTLKWTYSHPSKGIFKGERLLNKSGTAGLEFASIGAAMRAHSRLCEHHDEPAKHKAYDEVGQKKPGANNVSAWDEWLEANPNAL